MGSPYRCGQNSDGVLWCWGSDIDGTFGNGIAVTASPHTLLQAAGGKSYSQVAFGTRHMCGLNSGSAECWGYNEHGEAGGALGVLRYTPGTLGGGISFATITSGPNAFTTCGISTAGRAYCWGFGIFGQLGNGALTSSADPVLVKLVR
jgi:alpha-tubulin suppressor-like RCC1 family protein